MHLYTLSRFDQLIATSTNLEHYQKVYKLLKAIQAFL